MAELVIDSHKIHENFKKLSDFLSKHNMKWTLISKVLAGNKSVLKKILTTPQLGNIHSIGDSRLSSLKNIKDINPNIITMYIKPPAIKYANEVVKYSDISFNTTFEAIQALNQEAKKLDKVHSVIIMIELGSLREGILRDNIVEFYSKIFKLPNIKVIGLGTNIGCMYGIEPTYDKLIQLSLYKQLLEAKFDVSLELVSGGSSITLPLIEQENIPSSVNHFRIGEAVFLGTSPASGEQFKDLNTDAFEYVANIIEMEKKKIKPEGKMSDANVGHTSEISYSKDFNEIYRAVVDFGILDVDVKEIKPKDKKVKFLGTTSDMTVYSLGNNISEKSKTKKYNVGNSIKFNPSYMAVARLMSSKFVTKKVK